MRQIKKTTLLFIAFILCLTAVFLPNGLKANADSNNNGLLTGISPVGSPVLTEEMQSLSSVSVMTAGTTQKQYVYDGDENKLMYNRVTGMVFSGAGVVYNNDSQPLTYNDKKEQFEDSLKRRLELVERSTGGLQNYYLMFGSYKVRSIGINDTLYIARVKAKTVFNSGAAYDMLITRVWVSYKFFSSKWALILAGQYGEYEYYDLNGHEIAFKYFDVETKPNLMAGAGTSWAGGFVGFEKWGTILDLLDEIVYLMELVPPTGSPMGEFALNTVTGATLRDDRAQKIRLQNTGQLIDPMGWPLIGADARPLWWREDIRAYTNSKGELLDYGAENTLVEKSGFVAHSVISNVIAGLRIYLIYLADGTTLIPATLKTISTNPYVAEYYDMNGNKITLDEIVEPEISVDDRKENYPEEFPEDDWLTEFKNFFTNFFNALKKDFNAFTGFMSKYGKYILIGVLVIAVIIVLSIFAPIVFPILGTVIKAILKGIIFIIIAPFKLIKFLFSKDKE